MKVKILHMVHKWTELNFVYELDVNHGAIQQKWLSAFFKQHEPRYELRTFQRKVDFWTVTAMNNCIFLSIVY